jgi:stearoyl-CoA desaturase (delta-9 desaturase)
MSTDVADHPTRLSAAPIAAPTDPPVADAPPVRRPARYRKVLTALVALAPVLTAIFVVVRGIGNPIPWRDIALLVLFAAAIGHGVTIGFHRLFAHRSFVANRPLKIVLASLGSMSLQGSLIGWVADHRRHHRRSDRHGDPQSPLWKGEKPLRGVPGFWHAHLGWCFTNEATSREEYAPDLLADPDLVLIDRLFLPFSAATVVLPFAVGFVLSGTLAGALAALVWAGVLRIGITHNFTWSINSVCHRFGTRPFATRDASTNMAALSVFTMGESWHNNHHAFPKLARHGVDRHQLDSSARLIRIFERLGWATNVNWPDPRQLDARRAA